MQVVSSRDDARAGSRAAVHRGRSGSVLVGLLWCLALLSVLVVGILHSSQRELQLARFHADRIEARYLALAGIEKAKALLYRDARERSRAARNHSGALFNAPEQFKDITLGRGSYRVFRGGRPEEGGGVVFGVDDEESRLNINVASPDEFIRLEGLTPDIAAAIVDWRDENQQVTPGGAELEYYASLRPPSRPRDGRIQTVRELLMVRGVLPAAFLGGDTHLNGLTDEAGDDDADATRTGKQPATVARGWASSLTVESGVHNLSASGDDRVNIQTADEAALGRVPGITIEIAKGIVAHRGRNKFQSIADLLDVGPAPPAGAGPGPGQGVSGNLLPAAVPGGVGPAAAAPPGVPNPGGPKLISASLLIDIADLLTLEATSFEPGLMNVNTAGMEALMCLPGVTRELAQSIIGYRASAGYLQSTAALLRVPGMTQDLFKTLAKRVAVRSETFRILAEGRVKSSGVRQRLLATVRVGTQEVQTLACREDDL